MTKRDPAELRDRLAGAQLMLIFTPELCGAREPLAVLDALAGEVDVVQVRPKSIAHGEREAVASDPACEARATFEWTRRVLDSLASRDDAPLVLVNDRVDVAMALEDCDGVHLGQGDLPASEARALLGEAALIGLSTHDMPQVVRANEAPIDYLGFGPIFATSTKGYAHGVGPEACWIASSGSELPIFPIGGIDCTNAGELGALGRAAVSSALLAADDPAQAARNLRAELHGSAYL